MSKKGFRETQRGPGRDGFPIFPDEPPSNGPALIALRHGLRCSAWARASGAPERSASAFGPRPDAERPRRVRDRVRRSAAPPEPDYIDDCAPPRSTTTSLPPPSPHATSGVVAASVTFFTAGPRQSARVKRRASRFEARPHPEADHRVRPRNPLTSRARCGRPCPRSRAPSPH